MGFVCSNWRWEASFLSCMIDVGFTFPSSSKSCIEILDALHNSGTGK